MSRATLSVDVWNVPHRKIPHSLPPHRAITLSPPFSSVLGILVNSPPLKRPNRIKPTDCNSVQSENDKALAELESEALSLEDFRAVMEHLRVTGQAST